MKGASINIFQKDVNCYRVKKELKDVVLFAEHNILNDPAFSRQDLLVCRNLLIYLNRPTQDTVLQVFHFALKPDGYLFLGSSESADEVADLFAVVDKKNRIYKCISPASGTYRLPLAVSPPSTVGKSFQTESRVERESQFAYASLHASLLAQYAPPSVLICENLDILHSTQGSERFLRFVTGEPTQNLCKVLDPSLRADVVATLFAIQQGDENAESGPLLLKIEGVDCLVNIKVRPVEDTRGIRAFFLVIFEEIYKNPDYTGENFPVFKEDNGQQLLQRLESNLQHTKDRLIRSTQQHEISIEELKASNEEFQAMNEEFRSTTEELETSKEELQSINEEMTTLNAELKEKVEDAFRANSNLQNLLASTQIGTIFLNRSLEVRRFTPTVTTLFNIIPSDLGRPLHHLTHNLDYGNLKGDAEIALKTDTIVEREVQSLADERWYLVRILPCKIEGGSIDGVVVSFLDFTERKIAQDKLIEAH